MSVTVDGVKFYNKPRNRRFLLALLGVFEFILTIFLVITLAANVLMPEKATAAEGVSAILSYQGRLTDANGSPLGDTGTNYCFRFSIYDDAEVGAPDNPLWPSGTPSDNIVNVVNGVFNVGIGEADDLSTSTFNFASSTTVYLNVEAATSSGAVCGPYDNLAPRQRIDAVAYARVAYDLYGGQVRIGTGVGSTGIPKLLYLDVKSTSDTIGGACSPAGTLWYNSNISRALICDGPPESPTIQEVGNLGTIVGLGISGNVSGTPATITSGTITLAGGANVTLSQEGNVITISAGTGGGGGSIGAISAGATQATAGTVVFSNSNNVSFGMDGNTITASASGGGAAGSNTLGMSNLGNTAGATGVVSGSALQFLLAGGNKITLNQSIDANSATISISAADQSVQTQNIHYVTLAGNSTSAGAGYIQISSGTMTLAGGDNITLSQNGNAVTILGTGGGAAGVNTLGISNLGNTSGISGVVSGSALQFLLAGGNNITLNQSIDANSATITISAASQSVQTQNMVSVQGSTGNISFANSNNVSFGFDASTVTATASFNQSAEPRVVSLNGSSGTMSIAGASNVTVSNNASTITIYGPANILNSFSISGNTGTTGSSNITGGGFVLAASNNITFSQSNNTISIYGAATHAQQTGISGIAGSGASTATAGTVQFANANGITFGLDGNTITASHNALTSQTVQPVALSGSNASFTFSTATFGNSNGLSFYVTNGSMVASYTVPTQSAEPRVISLNGISGSMSISGASNITASNNASTITLYGPANILNSFSISGNTGTTGSSNITGGGFVLAASNNITFSQSNNTISIYGPTQSAEPRVISLNGISGSMSISGASNITASNNASTITLYGPANILNSFSISGNTGTTGSSNITGGGFVLAASNNITFSQSNNTISIYGASQSAEPRVISLNASTGQLTISAGNLMSISNNASTINVINVLSSSATAADVTTATNAGTLSSRFALADHAHRGVRAWNVTGIASTFFGDFAHSAGNLIALSTGGNTTAGTIGIHNLLSSATTASAVTTGNVIGAMASRFALEGHQHAGVGQFGVSNIGNTAGNTGLQYGNFVLSGQSNVTLSQITATGTQTVHTIGISAGGGGGGIAALGITNSSNAFTSGSVMFSGVNLTANTSVDGASQYIQLSVAAPGAAAENNWITLQGNIAPGANSSASGSTIAWSAGNNITFSGTQGSIVRIDAGGGGLTLSTFSPYSPVGLSTASVGGQTTTSNAVSVFPFVIDEYVSACALNLVGTGGFLTVGTSSGRQTAGYMVGIYTRGIGANSTTIGSLLSTSWSWQVTGNNSSYSINQVTTTNCAGYGATAQTNSAGSNISSGYTGAKLIAIPINALLTPGNYWLGIIGTNSSSSVTLGATLGFVNAVVNTAQQSLGPFGSFSSAYTRGNNVLAGRLLIGLGSWTSAGSVTGLPSSMAFTSISAGISQMPIMRFWST